MRTRYFHIIRCFTLLITQSSHIVTKAAPPKLSLTTLIPPEVRPQVFHRPSKPSCIGKILILILCMTYQVFIS